ncbi:MAG TPA: PQQ-binding-like beta-propeller repeat protein, partial [Phenylobacterium sp.]
RGQADADLALGEAKFKERCAGCHDNAADRTPPTAVIRDNTAPFIYSAMREGVMKPMSQGLSQLEVVSIATWLAQKKGGDVDRTALEAPLCTTTPKPLTLDGPSWNGWGRTSANPRFQPQPGFAKADVPRLKLKWALQYAGSRTGQATIVGGRLFTVSSSGAVYSLDAKTGCAFWRFNADAGARTTPVIGQLPAGGSARFAVHFVDATKHAYAIDAETGALLWKTQVEDHPMAAMTGTPVLHAGKLYVPLSSGEEGAAVSPAYPCCTFQGGVAALDAATGKLLWRTRVIPTPPAPFKTKDAGGQMFGPAGAAIWSAPTVDAKRGLLYVATGDSYTDVKETSSDAIVALDLNTGAIRWSHQLTEGDAYIIGCSPTRRGANCPTDVGPDADFGASPILHDVGGGRQVLLAGQKSGEIYALDPDNKGAIVWKHRPGVGGPLGGIQWSIAADKDNVYAPVTDTNVKDGKPGLTAIRVKDGKILWTSPAPTPACAWAQGRCGHGISQAIAAAPGVVFAGHHDGWFRAYDSATGKVLWEFDTAGQEHTMLNGRTGKGGVMDAAGVSVADGMVYVHSGYGGRGDAAGIVLLAFSFDGK